MNFYLDENLSEYVADALNNLNKGYFNNIFVSSTKLKFGKGAKDETIIPEIGREKGFLITKDFNIHKSRAQSKLCREYKIGVFFIHLPKGNDKHWELIKLLINNWERIVDIATKEHPPFAYEIPMRGKMRRI